MDVVCGFFQHVVRLQTLYLRHARDHVPLSSKPSTICSHQCRKITVFAFNPVTTPAIFSSDGWSFSFLKTEASVRLGFKAVFMLNCCSVRFTLSDIPWTLGTKARPAESGWWFCGPDLGWAAFSMNLVGYLLTCRLSWTWDVSSVLRASLEGMVFVRHINMLTTDLLR